MINKIILLVNMTTPLKFNPNLNMGKRWVGRWECCLARIYVTLLLKMFAICCVPLLFSSLLLHNSYSWPRSKTQHNHSSINALALENDSDLIRTHWHNVVLIWHFMRWQLYPSFPVISHNIIEFKHINSVLCTQAQNQ